ncbi:hypothetical protein BC828DRAFT_391827 [Blastocladiella britannica]|nr:hypothetical protein BC828DRAFT_391827 [Blastocladiella britannica]
MHQAHLGALTDKLRDRHSSFMWAHLIPEAPLDNSQTGSKSAILSRSIAELYANVAYIPQSNKESGTRVRIKRAPVLHHIHWRRIIAHKVPWTINSLTRAYNSQVFPQLPLLSAFSADAWVSLAPPTPTLHDCDPSRVSVAHLQETIAGAILTNTWRRNPPTHAFQHLMSAIACCCSSAPATAAIPPIHYSEVPVFLSPPETAIVGLATLLHPSDDAFAVRAVQHHLMVSYAMTAVYRIEYTDGEANCMNVTPPYLTTRMAARTHRFLDIRKTHSSIPFVNSALLSHFHERYPRNEDDQISHGLSALGVLQWHCTADISRHIGQRDDDTDHGDQFDERLQHLLRLSHRNFDGRFLLPMVEELQHFGIRVAELLAAKPSGWSPQMLAGLRRAEERQTARADAVALPLAERHPSEFDRVDAQSLARTLAKPCTHYPRYQGHMLAFLLEELQLCKNFKAVHACLNDVAKRALTYYDTDDRPHDTCEHLEHHDPIDTGAALLLTKDRPPTWACDACQVNATALLPHRDAPDNPVFACWPRSFESVYRSSEQKFHGRVSARRVIAALDRFPLKFDGSATDDRVLNDDLGMYPKCLSSYIPAKDFIDVCGMRVLSIVNTITDVVAQDPGAKVVVFCEYQQQINLIHDALVATGTKCAAVRHGIQSYLPLREFKCGLPAGRGRNGQRIDTTPAPALVMPYSVCDASLSLTEATHVILSHPYAGIDQSLTQAPPNPFNDCDQTEFGRGNWSEERWEYERLKWREVERRAVSCIVRRALLFFSLFSCPVLGVLTHLPLKIAGQTCSVQVIRLYAAGTREAVLAQQFGNPLATAPGSGGHGRCGPGPTPSVPKQWSQPGTVRSADVIMYSNRIVRE